METAGVHAERLVFTLYRSGIISCSNHFGIEVVLSKSNGGSNEKAAWVRQGPVSIV